MARSYFVPDLSPEAHPENFSRPPRVVFVGESPHKNEVEPARELERRPLCGKAGVAWWSMVGEVFEKKAVSDVSLENLLEFCARNRIAVINAVQSPMDPAIAKHYPDADPLQVLGFMKGPGPNSYKKKIDSKEVKKTIASLKRRLNRPEMAGVPIYSLGGDSEWFVSQALGKEEFQARFQGKIPHPSCWWRNQNFKKTAREKLEAIKNQKSGRP